VVGHDAEAYLARHVGGVEAALERALAAAEPLLPAPLAAAARHGVTSGGKRLRPILCVAAHETVGGATDDRVYDLGAALEMIHAYSLMHDDLPCMDDAELRRGQPTTHVAHGDWATTLAGAALIPLAARQALRAARALGCEEARARRITTVLLEGAGGGGMVGGQWLDLVGEGRSVTAAELDELHRRKTGALLTASLVIGGLAGSADEAALAALESYGGSVGLAFQITDDVLDATGSAETLGKNPSDSALDKSTYVAIHGLEEARRRAAEEVGRALAALAGAGLDDRVLGPVARYVVARTK
jgi:geranylgeranyl pyrophosphate synthase